MLTRMARLLIRIARMLTRMTRMARMLTRWLAGSHIIHTHRMAERGVSASFWAVVLTNSSFALDNKTFFNCTFSANSAFT